MEINWHLKTGSLVSDKERNASINKKKTGAPSFQVIKGMFLTIKAHSGRELTNLILC